MSAEELDRWLEDVLTWDNACLAPHPTRRLVCDLDVGHKREGHACWPGHYKDPVVWAARETARP